MNLFRFSPLLYTDDAGAGDSEAGGSEETSTGGSEETVGSEETSTEFDPVKWDGKVESVPDTHKAFFDRMTADHKKSGAFDAVKAMRDLVSDVTTQRVEQKASTETDTDYSKYSKEQVDELVNQRSQQQIVAERNKDVRERFLDDMDGFISAPKTIGGGHNVHFSDRDAVEQYHDSIKTVLTKGLSPEQFYILHKWEKILADVGEQSARKREEELGKLGKVPKTKIQPEQKGKKSEGVKDGDLSVEELFKRDNPQEYADLYGGKKAFG